MLMINRHVLFTFVLLIGLSVDVYAAESSDSTIVDESLQTVETPPDEFAPVDMSTPDKSNTYQSKLQFPLRAGTFTTSAIAGRSPAWQRRLSRGGRCLRTCGPYHANRSRSALSRAGSDRL